MLGSDVDRRAIASGSPFEFKEPVVFHCLLLGDMHIFYD